MGLDRISFGNPLAVNYTQHTFLFFSKCIHHGYLSIHPLFFFEEFLKSSFLSPCYGSLCIGWSCGLLYHDTCRSSCYLLHTLLLSASYKFCPSTLLNSLGIPPLMHLLTDPLPKTWLGRGFVLMFGVSLNVIHSALINCRSFYLKALQIWMLCSATLAWYSQVRSGLY